MTTMSRFRLPGLRLVPGGGFAVAALEGISLPRAAVAFASPAFEPPAANALAIPGGETVLRTALLGLARFTGGLAEALAEDFGCALEER